MAANIPCALPEYVLDYFNRLRFGLQCIPEHEKEIIKSYMNFLNCPCYLQKVDCKQSKC